MKVLMVCLGNICRSPMAEGILRDKAIANNLSIETDSCGTANYHTGEPADSRGVRTLANKGIDISDLRARQFRVSDYSDFDLIYCMDLDNYNNIITLAPNQELVKKVRLILDEIEDFEDSSSVPDPYYGGDSGFNHVYDLLDQATNVIIEKYV